MRIVVALGGNALLRRGEPLTQANQRANVRRAAAALAPLCIGENELIITHGNGPQVGLLALQSAAGPHESQQPLDVLGAESEGMLGYLIEQELRNTLPPGKEVVSVLTQVAVSLDDPAFAAPSKPIGPVYSENEARCLSLERGWSIVRDGMGWRRAIASPRPLSILELRAIELLASSGSIVICVGGGGIPVMRDTDCRLIGVEAVIDKDSASALLARELRADLLLLLTDVDGVYLDWERERLRPVAVAGPEDLDPQLFEAGTMRPKVEAAVEFARRTGKRAAIGRLEDASALVAGTAGTVIGPEQDGLQVHCRA
jgi:carbamate kinase